MAGTTAEWISEQIDKANAFNLNYQDRIKNIWIDVKELGATGNGSTDDSDALQDAIDEIGSYNTILYFSSETAEVGDGASAEGGTYRINSDLTFPANIDLWFSANAKLVIESGSTVTINGNINTFDKLSEIITGDGTYVYNGENRLDVLENIGADVTSSANITDNAIVRGDGGAKGIQESGIIVDDSDSITGANSLTTDGWIYSKSNIFIDSAYCYYMGDSNEAYISHWNDFEFLNSVGNSNFYASNTQKAMKFDGTTGAVELYYDNSKKLETTTDGITVTGDIVVSGTIDGIKPRIGSTTSSSSLTINSDSYDQYIVTALSEAMTINEPSGTPTNGQWLYMEIKDNGTTRALTWNAVFTEPYTNASFPSNTTAGKNHILWFRYDTSASKWKCVISDVEA